MTEIYINLDDPKNKNRIAGFDGIRVQKNQMIFEWSVKSILELFSSKIDEILKIGNSKEPKMDKKIKALKKKIDKGMNKLIKEDIPRDKKLKKCAKVMKKK